MRILIIDDDREDTDIFCEAITDIFHDAICTFRHSCRDIKSVLDELPAQDVIFLDGHMHSISGEQCLKELKQIVLPDTTKIVIHSGSLSPSEIESLKKIRIDDLILKAFSYEGLKSTLKTLLKEKFQIA